MSAERQGLAPTSIWKRIVNVMRVEGLRGLSQRIAERIRRAFGFSLAYLLVYPLESTGSIPVTGIPQDVFPHAKVNMTVERVFPEDRETINELAQVYGVPAAAEGILNRMSRVDLCFIARVDGRIAGYAWFRLAGAVYDGGVRLFDIAEGEVYNHDDYVVPAWRGKNIYPALKTRAAHEIATETGRRRMICCVHYYNKPSLNASRKVGEYRAGRTGYLKLFGRKIPYLIRTRMVRL